MSIFNRAAIVALIIFIHINSFAASEGQRNSTVDLQSWQVEVNFALKYFRNYYDYSLFHEGEFDRYGLEVQKTQLATTLSVGMFGNMELSLNMPLQYNYAKDISGEHTDHYENYGLSDISASFRYRLINESDKFPSISIGLMTLIPIGDSPYQDIPKDAVALSGGHYANSLSLAFTKNVDPIVLFGGTYYNYYYSTTKNGNKYKPGDSIYFYLGGAFAVNNKISVSATFSGDYITDLYYNGKLMTGTRTFPVTMSYTLSYQIDSGDVVDFTVLNGLNKDATDVIFGMSYTLRFQ